MPAPDFNLLIALDVLLSEGNVARAARRLQLSPSAMSRTLARLRLATGDPLLVRAGRGLVPTPRANELRAKVTQLVRDTETLLRPARAPDMQLLVRTFTLRTSEGFAESFGPALLARTSTRAPGVTLRFVQKLDKDSAPLRDGEIDLETGVVTDTMGPELRAQALFRDRFVGVVRSEHALARGEITPARYAGGRHVGITRRGLAMEPIDAALTRIGLKRTIAIVVGGFSTALALARTTDLIASVPERHTGNLRLGMVSFPLPLPTPEFTVSLLWHPRFQADAAHRWLRDMVVATCAAVPQMPPAG